ncbi:MAG: type II toxin-antitoxin system Phd/YefM family antitoxin [Lentisphaerae bacterium]|nr:type II toxin-antitoxin system Phd/YefM family antitoxin [Lentisphaerota bacterium]
MIAVNVHEAKTQLSKLLTRVSAGEEVVISRYGHPVASLIPCATHAEKRRGGADRGLFTLPDDFDDELPELNQAFES